MLSWVGMADDSDDRSEEDRAAILRRRAVFVASAVAGLGLASSCGESGTPRACLDVSRPEPATTEAATAEPQPCLDIAPPVVEDAGVPQSNDGGTDAGSPTGADAGVDGGKPQPCLRKAPPPTSCLKVAPPPPPQVCLDIDVK
jgi:hypothetical protein